MSWPTVVLAGGVGLSLAANLAQAQPTAWGQVVAAVPSVAFLVAVSMIERRAARRAQPAAGVPGQDGDASDLSGPGRPSPAQDGEDEALLAAARRAAAGHQQAHGQPITRDALRAQLGVSNQAASGLLRQLRSGEGAPARSRTRRLTRQLPARAAGAGSPAGASPPGRVGARVGGGAGETLATARTSASEI